MSQHHPQRWHNVVATRNVEWEDGPEGGAVLLVPRFRKGPLAKWLQPKLKRPHIRVKLDEIGSFAWHMMDGRTPFYKLVEAMKEHFGEIETLRRELPADVYLWINACKDRHAYYDEQDVRRCEAVDPHFRINNVHHSSRGRRCRAGRAAISVDGGGTVRRCHFVDRPLGNLYDDTLEDVLQAGPCPNSTCGCHIGYVYLGNTLTSHGKNQLMRYAFLSLLHYQCVHLVDREYP